MLDYILHLIENGNWLDAIEEFQAFDPTGKEFGDALYDLTVEELKDLALLGFYSRAYKRRKG